MCSHSSCLFSHWSVTVGGLWLVRFHSSCLFDTGQSLLVDFGLCVSTRLVCFLTLVSRCWRTLTCVLPLVLSFSHWSVAVGGLWLVYFHPSCLFDTGQSLLVDFDLCAPTRLVFFHTGQSLLVDFGLYASTRLVFFTLVSRCWWTLDCVLPPVLSVLTLVSRCWWTLACALPLVLSFF